MSLPKDVYIVIPRTYQYITLHGKRDFTEVIKLRILIIPGDYSGLPGSTQGDHKGSYTGWKESQSKKKMDNKVRAMQSQEPRNVGKL